MSNKRILTIKNNAYDISHMLIYIKFEQISLYDLSFGNLRIIKINENLKKQMNKKIENLKNKIDEVLNNNGKIDVYFKIIYDNESENLKYVYFNKILSFVENNQIKLTIESNDLCITTNRFLIEFNKINKLHDFAKNPNNVFNVITNNINVISVLVNDYKLNINKLITYDKTHKFDSLLNTLSQNYVDKSLLRLYIKNINIKTIIYGSAYQIDNKFILIGFKNALSYFKKFCKNDSIVYLFSEDNKYCTSQFKYKAPDSIISLIQEIKINNQKLYIYSRHYHFNIEEYTIDENIYYNRSRRHKTLVDCITKINPYNKMLAEYGLL